MRSETNDDYRDHGDPLDKAPAEDGSVRKRLLSLSDALCAAEQRLNEIPIRQPILDFLFSKTRCQSMARAEWESHVRLATALDHTLRRNLRWVSISHVIDKSDRMSAFRQLSDPATMVLGHHGGFSLFTRKVYERLFPNGVTVASHGKYSARDGVFALFAAREALLGNNPVFIAPDGNFGKESGTISVLGAQLLVTDGAPFLAYETKCDVKWFSIIRSEDRFTVQTADLCRARSGETFLEFRERFYRFYADQLELSFTGDPRNLSLRHPLWSLVFRAMLAGKIYNARRLTR